MATSGGAAQHRAKRLLDKAEKLARPLNNPYLTGLQSLINGTCAYFCGRWRAAIEHCRDAETTFRDHCTGVTWELDTAIGFGLSARSFAGEVRELAERLPSCALGGRQSGGTFMPPATTEPSPSRRWQLMIPSVLQQTLQPVAPRGLPSATL